MTVKNIELGKGIGNLKFGITRKQVVALLGEPSEKETIEEDEDMGSSEAWHYDELELSVTFDEDDDWKLSSIAASSSEFTFEGIDLLGLSQEEVMQQIEIMNLGDIETEEIIGEESEDQQVATIAEVSLNLWFENGKLSEIQWAPYWDEDEETYIWPE